VQLLNEPLGLVGCGLCGDQTSRHPASSSLPQRLLSSFKYRDRAVVTARRVNTADGEYTGHVDVAAVTVE
jgi:hypothetical protein